MRSLSGGAAVLALVLIMATADQAGAQNAAQAESLFKQAKQLRDSGKLAEACDLFTASHRLDPSPATLMNAADCREKKGDLASAWEAYVSVERQVRGDGKYGKLADLARDRAAALEARLSFLTINVPDENRVEGLEVLRDGVVIEPGGWNRALPIDGGRHTISGRAPGHETWSTTVEVEREADKQQVEVPRFKALRDPTGKTIVINRDEPSPFTTRRKIAIGVASAGVVSIVAGGFLGLRAQSLQDDADGRCPPGACSPDQAAQATALSDDSARASLFANLAFGVGAGAIVGGAVLWLTGAPAGPEAPGRVSLTPRVAPAFVGLRAEMRF